MCLMLWCNAWGAPCARVSPLWSVRSTPRSLVVPTCTPCSWGLHIMHTVKSIPDGSVSAKLATGLGTRQGKVWLPRPSPVVGKSKFFFHKRIAQHIALISVLIVLVHLRTRSRCPPPIAAVVPPCWRPCRDMPAIQSPPQIAYQSPLVPLCCVLILLARCGAAGSLRRK